nr:MAG TPA: hypothetical protein [Caudoviricetes sp.]
MHDAGTGCTFGTGLDFLINSTEQTLGGRVTAEFIEIIKGFLHVAVGFELFDDEGLFGADIFEFFFALGEDITSLGHGGRELVDGIGILFGDKQCVLALFGIDASCVFIPARHGGACFRFVLLHITVGFIALFGSGIKTTCHALEGVGGFGVFILCFFDGFGIDGSSPLRRFGCVFNKQIEKAAKQDAEFFTEIREEQQNSHRTGSAAEKEQITERHRESPPWHR